MIFDFLEKADELLRSEQLCDRCLGRCFAKLGSGLTNEERGRTLRLLFCMSRNQILKEPEKCTICQSLFQSVDRWMERALECSEGYEFQTYLVGTRVPRETEESEKALWERHQIDPKKAEPLKQEFNREVGKRLGRALKTLEKPAEVDFQEPQLVLLLDLERDHVELQVNSLFIYGRYRKLIRGIPQTKWPCRTCRGRGCKRCHYMGKMYSESVEELIADPALEVAQGQAHSFHGAGREDIDARMLGKGRPFVLEIKAPRRRSLDLASLEQEINEHAHKKVEVSGLRLVKGNAVGEIKQMEAEKTYRVRVIFGSAVSEEVLQNVLRQLVGEIEQRTPRRVSHRRADLVRKRRIFSISGRLTGPCEALIELVCEGGLYVKELISGDEGRTCPSLAKLLEISAQVTELDVLEVRGDLLLSPDGT